MVCKFISDWMCKHGNHDFKVAASWTSVDKSLVLQEDICTRCGEDAYSIITFKPNKCTALTRSTDKLDELLQLATEDSHRGRRAEDWLKENEKECKSTKRTQAKKEAAVKN